MASDNGFGWDGKPSDVDPTLIFTCRQCGGHRPGFLTRTVDPRWYIGPCLDCGSKKAIFDSLHRTPSLQESEPIDDPS